MVGDPQKFAFLRADAYCEDSDTLFRSHLGHFLHPAFVVLTIGKDHQYPVVVGVLLESFHRRVDCFCQGGSSLGHDVDADGIQTLSKGVFIECQWALKKCSPGKGYQPQSIGFGQFDQIHGGQFSPFQSIGDHILSQHAARSVDCNQDIDTALFGFFPSETPLGSGNADQDQGGSQNE